MGLAGGAGRGRRLGITAIAVLGAFALPSIATAQAPLTSGVVQLSLTAERKPSLTLGLEGSASLSISDLQPGQVNDFGAPVGVRSDWQLADAGTVSLVGYFDDPGHAMAGPGAAITSSAVEGRVASGAGYQPFAGSPVNGVGTSGGTLQLFTEGTASSGGSRRDDLFLRLNLTNVQLPTGVYSGTLKLRLVVQ